MQKKVILDIETHRKLNYDEAPDLLTKVWEDRYYNEDEFESITESYNTLSGLHAEFSSVICISCGIEDHEGNLKVKSFCDEDEEKLLQEFSDACGAFSRMGYTLVGHNIIDFDVPYLCKRYVINGLPIPKFINFMGLKPWEISVEDTMNMWKFGGRSMISLQALCACLGIDSKSGDLNGKTLNKLEYSYVKSDEGISKVRNYCEEDVMNTHKVYKLIKSCL
jgi:DNA polymerase elongation subunit (family B)